MAVSLTSLAGMVCDKLDTNAGVFWDNAELKQFHRRFIEMNSLLQSPRSCHFDQSVALSPLFTHLEGLISEIDELIDAWVQSEISRSKFDHELRRIDAQLAPVLKVLSHTLAPSQIVAGDCDEAVGSISQVRSEHTVLRHLRPCVVVTTSSDCVETMIRTVPAHHLTYFPENNTLSDFNNDLPPSSGAHSCRLGHEEDLRLEAPESLQTASTSGVKDELLGRIEEPSKNGPTPNPEAESAMDEDAPPGLNNLNEEMVCPPPTNALAMERVGRLAAHVAGTMVTSSNVELEEKTFQSGMELENEDFQSEMEFEDETF